MTHHDRDNRDTLLGACDPYDCCKAPRVVVFGAGISGLSAAQELIERGFEVHVVDPTGQCEVKVGGIARTQWAHVPVPGPKPALGGPEQDAAWLRYCDWFAQPMRPVFQVPTKECFAFSDPTIEVLEKRLGERSEERAARMTSARLKASSSSKGAKGGKVAEGAEGAEGAEASKAPKVGQPEDAVVSEDKPFLDGPALPGGLGLPLVQDGPAQDGPNKDVVAELLEFQDFLQDSLARQQKWTLTSKAQLRSWSDRLDPSRRLLRENDGEFSFVDPQGQLSGVALRDMRSWFDALFEFEYELSYAPRVAEPVARAMADSISEWLKAPVHAREDPESKVAMMLWVCPPSGRVPGEHGYRYFSFVLPQPVRLHAEDPAVRRRSGDPVHRDRQPRGCARSPPRAARRPPAAAAAPPPHSLLRGAASDALEPLGAAGRDAVRHSPPRATDAAIPDLVVGSPRAALPGGHVVGVPRRSPAAAADAPAAAPHATGAHRDGRGRGRRAHAREHPRAALARSPTPGRRGRPSAQRAHDPGVARPLEGVPAPPGGDLPLRIRRVPGVEAPAGPDPTRGALRGVLRGSRPRRATAAVRAHRPGRGARGVGLLRAGRALPSGARADQDSAPQHGLYARQDRGRAHVLQAAGAELSGGDRHGIGDDLARAGAAELGGLSAEPADATILRCRSRIGGMEVPPPVHGRAVLLRQEHPHRQRPRLLPGEPVGAVVDLAAAVLEEASRSSHAAVRQHLGGSGQLHGVGAGHRWRDMAILARRGPDQGRAPGSVEYGSTAAGVHGGWRGARAVDGRRCARVHPGHPGDVTPASAPDAVGGFSLGAAHGGREQRVAAARRRPLSGAPGIDSRPRPGSTWTRTCAGTGSTAIPIRALRAPSPSASSICSSLPGLGT